MSRRRRRFNPMTWNTYYDQTLGKRTPVEPVEIGQVRYKLRRDSFATYVPLCLVTSLSPKLRNTRVVSFRVSNEGRALSYQTTHVERILYPIVLGHWSSPKVGIYLTLVDPSGTMMKNIREIAEGREL
jgi:hypothetical protein